LISREFKLKLKGLLADLQLLLAHLYSILLFWPAREPIHKLVGMWNRGNGCQTIYLQLDCWFCHFLERLRIHVHSMQHMQHPLYCCCHYYCCCCCCCCCRDTIQSVGPGVKMRRRHFTLQSRRRSRQEYIVVWNSQFRMKSKSKIPFQIGGLIYPPPYLAVRW
jgi:hypothetical protein